MTANQVTKHVTAKPNLIQIAQDGAWEKAWIISLKEKSPTEKNLIGYLNRQKFKTVAIEVVFDQADGTYILGLDYNELHPTTSALTFLQTIIKLTYQFETFNKYINLLAAQLVGHTYLLNQEPDVIRIGIVKSLVFRRPDFNLAKRLAKSNIACISAKTTADKTRGLRNQSQLPRHEFCRKSFPEFPRPLPLDQIPMQ